MAVENPCVIISTMIQRFAVTVLCLTLSACARLSAAPVSTATPSPEPARPLALVTLAATSTPASTPSPVPIQRQTSTPRPTTTPTPTLTPTPASWTRLAPGIEERYVPAQRTDNDAIFYLYALRIDPSRVTFRVHYQEGEAQTIEEWQSTIGTGIILNGGFFSGGYTPVGRIVMDGTMYGFPLNYGEGTIGVAGLFTVLDGEVALYSIGRSSYSPRGMRFDEAVESYPLLLLPGRQPTYPTETGERARRTVIGLDDHGRVMVLVSDLPIFSLHELSGWLAQSDLNIDSALNLDGGRSTGIAVSLPGGSTLIPSYVPVPIVIGIYPD